MRKTRGKFLLAFLSGIIVAAIAIGVDLAFVRFDRTILIHHILGGCIAGLVTTIVTLALQLRQEEQHFLFAAERAAVLAELNHHVRNAIFPLCVYVARSGEPEATRIANECVERINLALRDATVDASVGRFSHTRPERKVRQAAA
jgi:hypothetical protein